MYRDPQWEKLSKVDKQDGSDAALALIYQWVKTNVISKPDFIEMVRYVHEDPAPDVW
jgi:hypothetical protein